MSSSIFLRFRTRSRRASRQQSNQSWWQPRAFALRPDHPVILMRGILSPDLFLTSGASMLPEAKRPRRQIYNRHLGPTLAICRTDQRRNPAGDLDALAIHGALLVSISR